MPVWTYVYCAVLGLCNYLILRELCTFGIIESLRQNIGNPRIRLGTAIGIIATLVGGIAHRYAGFNPDSSDPWAWAIALGLPLVLAFATRSQIDPGWRALQEGKNTWQRLPFVLPVGRIEQSDSQYRNHPSFQKARDLIRSAIDRAPESNLDPVSAAANSAIALQELGLLHRAVNDLEKAGEYFGMSLAKLSELAPESRAHPRVLHARRDILFRLGELNHVQGSHESARRFYLDSLEIDRKLGHDDPVGESTTEELLSKLSPRDNGYDAVQRTPI